MQNRSDRVCLRFEDSGGFHDDLVLELGDRQWRCDSYYLMLDPMFPEREDASKVRAVLQRLLQQWCAAVTGLFEGDVCYLPYDFSDEYTGWLRCGVQGPMLKVQRGWADVHGYSFSPSEVGELLRNVPGFRPDGDGVVIERDLFVRLICGDAPTR